MSKRSETTHQASRREPAVTRLLPRTAVLCFLLCGVLSVASLSSSAWAYPADPQPQPWISTDQPDYAPGSTVVVTGGNWQAGEAVHLVANDDQGEIWRH